MAAENPTSGPAFGEITSVATAAAIETELLGVVGPITIRLPAVCAADGAITYAVPSTVIRNVGVNAAVCVGETALKKNPEPVRLQMVTYVAATDMDAEAPRKARLVKNGAVLGSLLVVGPAFNRMRDCTATSAFKCFGLVIQRLTPAPYKADCGPLIRPPTEKELMNT